MCEITNANMVLNNCPGVDDRALPYPGPNVDEGTRRDQGPVADHDGRVKNSGGRDDRGHSVSQLLEVCHQPRANRSFTDANKRSADLGTHTRQVVIMADDSQVGRWLHSVRKDPPVEIPLTGGANDGGAHLTVRTVPDYDNGVHPSPPPAAVG